MNALTQEMKISCCKVCLLADAMKDCQNCPFNVGLPFRLLDIAKRLETQLEREMIASHVAAIKTTVFSKSNPVLTPA